MQSRIKSEAGKMIKPEKRAYQEKALRKIEHFGGRALLAYEMRMGKTFISLQWLKNHPEISSAVVVCPEIGKFHWEEKAKRYFGIRSVVLNGITPPKRKSIYKNRLYIVNWEILQYWVEFLQEANVVAPILDECFVYETLISTNQGPLPIGKIVEEKIDCQVLTYNFSKKKIESKSILRYIKKKRTKHIIRIEYKNGYFDCTKEHKIWENKSQSYRKAGELQIGDVLSLLQKEFFISKDRKKNKKILLSKMCKTCFEKTLNRENLRTLWKEIRLSLTRKTVQFKKKILQPILFSKMENETTRNTNANLYRGKNSEGEKIQRKMVQNKRGALFQKRSIKENEKTECQSEIQKKNEKNTPKQERKDLVGRAGWKWLCDRPSTFTFQTSETANGVFYKDHKSKASFSESSELLQSRPCNSKRENSNRSRRWKPQAKEAKISRPQENRSIKLIRVEGNKILERRCDGQYRESDKKNSRVYDLEIEGNHNYFANNILVSNCHYIKERKTQCYKATRKLVRGLPYLLGLGGTPLKSRPIELFNILNLLRPDKWSSYWKYAFRYCEPKRRPWGWEFKGKSHIDELYRDMNAWCLVRMLRADAMGELPKDRRIIPINIDFLRRVEYEEAEYNFIKWLSKRSVAKANKARKAERLVQMGYLKRLAAELKMQNALKWIDRWLDKKKGKLAVFAIHKEIIQQLQNRYKGKCVVVDGTVRGRKRHLAVKIFQDDKKCRVFIGNTKAAGTVIELSKAKAAVGVELDWTPGDVTQWEDRIFDPNKKEPLRIYYLVAKDTIEHHLCEILQAKQDTVSEVLDGSKKKNRLSIFDELQRKLLQKG